MDDTNGDDIEDTLPVGTEGVVLPSMGFAPFSTQALRLRIREVDPMAMSDNHGIDLYERTI